MNGSFRTSLVHCSRFIDYSHGMFTHLILIVSRRVTPLSQNVVQFCLELLVTTLVDHSYGDQFQSLVVRLSRR